MIASSISTVHYKVFSKKVIATCHFNFYRFPTFAENQLVTIMDVITIESKAFKELEAKINAIADYILNKQESENINEDEIWVDSYEVCTFLKISDKTLQRLRVSGTIAYSNIRGRYFYKIGEIKRMLEERLIKSNSECLNDLVTNHKLYVKERRNLRKNK